MTESQTPPLKPVPLLTPDLLLFMLAMILANMGGNMYGPLRSAVLEGPGRQYRADRLILHPVADHSAAAADPGRLGIGLPGTPACHRHRQRGGHLCLCSAAPGTRWEWVLLASALSAMTRSLVGPSFDAFIADHSAPENRARLFGITQTLFGVVSVVGPVLGGYMVEALASKGCWRWLPRST